MTNYSELISEIKGETPGAAEPIIEQHIKNAAIEFCKRTLVLRRTLEPITIEADTALYALTSPDNTNVVQVMSAQIDDHLPLTQASRDLLDLWWREGSPAYLNLCNWGCGCSSNTDTTTDWRQFTQDVPQMYYIDQESASLYRMRLVGIPTTQIADSLVVNIAIAPTRESTEIDDWLFAEYFDQLSSGAKGRLMRMPKKQWTDLTLAKYYLEKFEDDKEAARMESMRDFVRDDEVVSHVQAWP